MPQPLPYIGLAFSPPFSIYHHKLCRAADIDLTLVPNCQKESQLNFK